MYRRATRPSSNGEVPITNFDETPVRLDMLVGEEVATERGSSMVAVSVSSRETRGRCAAALSMTSDRFLPTPGPMVAFACAGTGVRSAKDNRDEVERTALAPFPVFFTQSGNTTSQLTPARRKEREKKLGPRDP